MTLYYYTCKKCGEFSEFRDKNDREVCKCGNPVKKTFGSAFKLYGPGFYKTEVAISDVNKHH